MQSTFKKVKSFKKKF